MNRENIGEVSEIRKVACYVSSFQSQHVLPAVIRKNLRECCWAAKAIITGGYYNKP